MIKTDRGIYSIIACKSQICKVDRSTKLQLPATLSVSKKLTILCDYYFNVNTMADTMTGTIKKMITDKGFGFITGEGLEKDLFFHSSSLVGITFPELKEGDTVTFEKAESPKGLNAVNVQLAGAEQA